MAAEDNGIGAVEMFGGGSLYLVNAGLNGLYERLGAIADDAPHVQLRHNFIAVSVGIRKVGAIGNKRHCSPFC